MSIGKLWCGMNSTGVGKGLCQPICWVKSIALMLLRWHQTIQRQIELVGGIHEINGISVASSGEADCSEDIGKLARTHGPCFVLWTVRRRAGRER